MIMMVRRDLGKRMENGRLDLRVNKSYKDVAWSLVDAENYCISCEFLITLRYLNILSLFFYLSSYIDRINR